MPFPFYTGDDGTGLLMEKKKQFEEDVNASFRSLNENLQSILREREEREEIPGEFVSHGVVMDADSSDTSRYHNEILDGPLVLVSPFNV